jgi:hypothetical protein
VNPSAVDVPRPLTSGPFDPGAIQNTMTNFGPTSANFGTASPGVVLESDMILSDDPAPMTFEAPSNFDAPVVVEPVPNMQ